MPLPSSDPRRGRRPGTRGAAAAATVAAAAAVLVALAAGWPGDGGRRAEGDAATAPGPAAAAPPAATATATSSRVCVTRHGLCPIGPVPAGAPCDCPHPLRGSVPGRVGVLAEEAPGDGDGGAPRGGGGGGGGGGVGLAGLRGWPGGGQWRDRGGTGGDDAEAAGPLGRLAGP